MNPADDITIIVLAGGRSRRLGQDKAVVAFGGEPLMRRVIRRASAGVRAAGAGGDVVVVVSSAARAAALPLAPEHRVAVDRFPDGGALGGIYTGLEASCTEWALVVACDLPFISPALVGYMAGRERRAGVDAVAPMIDGRAEPTYAIYSRRCRPAIRERLTAGQLKAAGFLDDVAVRYITEAEIRRYDPMLLSFCNINYPQDLARARELARAGK